MLIRFVGAINSSCGSFSRSNLPEGRVPDGDSGDQPKMVFMNGKNDLVMAKWELGIKNGDW